MNANASFGIYFFPGVPMFNRKILAELVGVFERSGPFKPEQWGANERARLPFDGQEVVDHMSRESPGLQQASFYRSGKISYEGSFTNAERPFLSLRMQVAYDFSLYRVFFALAEAIAVVVHPIYGTAHVFWPTQVPWQSEIQRLHRWMHFCAMPTPKTFWRNGPLGLGLHTYFSGKVRDFLGESLLSAAPVFRAVLSWGGLRLDLIESDEEPKLEVLLPRWQKAMEFFLREAVIAQPVFHSERRTVEFTPAPKWKYRAR
jgi:hypothetical protein